MYEDKIQKETAIDVGAAIQAITKVANEIRVQLNMPQRPSRREETPERANATISNQVSSLIVDLQEIDDVLRDALEEVCRIKRVIGS